LLQKEKPPPRNADGGLSLLLTDVPCELDVDVGAVNVDVSGSEHALDAFVRHRREGFQELTLVGHHPGVPGVVRSGLTGARPGDERGLSLRHNDSLGKCGDETVISIFFDVDADDFSVLVDMSKSKLAFDVDHLNNDGENDKVTILVGDVQLKRFPGLKRPKKSGSRYLSYVVGPLLKRRHYTEMPGH